MDKLIEYPKLIKRILTEYVELCNRRPLFDSTTHHSLASVRYS
jgi:hypothetical protein